MNIALLKTERVKRGVTQEAIAKHLGYKDKSSYCLIEKGRIAVSTDTASKIVAFLKLPDDVAYEIFFKS
ncbi:MAG: helix-turn-helix transcriptional regulator [Lachnospiraceae bacterium]|nr:helix-turn-helix transcriptional regulator [Lachnospiraceae bacterium]